MIRKQLFMLSCALLCSLFAVAQMPLDPETGKFKYQEVVHAEGTQQEMFVRAVSWVNNNYKNAAAVTSIRDPHTGVIEGNHRIQIRLLNKDSIVEVGEMILYHFKLQFKEGRYRYTFDKFLVRKQSRFALEQWTDKDSPDYREDQARIQQIVDERISQLIASLKETMDPEQEKEEEEW